MARTINISERGIMFESLRRFDEGTELEIMFNVMDDCIIAKGKVIREIADGGRYRIAVHFTQLTPTDHGILEKYLNSNFPYTRYSH